MAIGCDSLLGEVTTRTSDGRTLAFEELGATFSIWTLRVSPAHQPEPFLRAPYSVREAAFSPDGRWLAYTSRDTGQDEIYVRSFPAAGGTWQVSARGGNTPRWSADEKELVYYVDDILMVATVTPGPTFQAAAPRPLFRHKLRWDRGVSAFSVPDPDDTCTSPATRRRSDPHFVLKV